MPRGEPHIIEKGDVMPLRLSRRALFKRGAFLLISSPVVFAVLQGGRRDDARDSMMGSMSQEMPEWMMSRSTMAGMMADMPVIRRLLMHHDRIERHVEDFPDGIRSITTPSWVPRCPRRLTSVREKELTERCDDRSVWKSHKPPAIRIATVPGRAVDSGTCRRPSSGSSS